MNIGIIGLGLIGGSLGRALVKNGGNTVYGFDKDDETVSKAELLSAFDCVLDDESYKKLDVLIIATPPSVTFNIIEETCKKLKDGAIIIDTCGVKRRIVEKMKSLSKIYPKLEFVGAHPMAGREFSGINHSSATLFEKAYIVLVPVTGDLNALSVIKQLFISIGAQDVEICGADKHDEMISYTSQLAHIVSNAYVKNELSSVHAGFSAGSFRDMTRVAKLDPEMWTELFLCNRDNLVKDIDVLLENIRALRDAVDTNDAGKVRLLLESGVKMKEDAETARKERLK